MRVCLTRVLLCCLWRAAGEYIVYTALAWRNKAFGSGLEFVWSADSNDYAIRETGSRIKISKNFQVTPGVRP